MQPRSRCAWVGKDPLMIAYHDREWGMPLHDDQKLFEFLCLEGAQAGLSWITILKKRDNYREAFHHFDAGRIARYTQTKIDRLLANEGIVRNRLKGWIRVNRRPRRYEPANATVAGPEERAIDADDHSRIKGALSMLTERDRELLWLREVEGLTYGEIGGRFGAATGTIRVACHRARKRLERAYQKESG